MSEDDLNPKKRGLGRGLNALFENNDDVSPQDEAENQPQGTGRKVVGIELLSANPNQPRRIFNEPALAELSESIKRHGLLQPILVRPHPTLKGEAYQIIAGERRWRAAQRAQLHEVPVVIRTFDEAEALQIGLVENLQREDLNPMEEAEGYQALIDLHGYKAAEVGEFVGKSRSHVANIIRLNGLPEAVKQMLRDGLITAGHARALLSADDPLARAHEVIEQGLSVRQTEGFGIDAGKRSDSHKTVSRETAPPQHLTRRDADAEALEKEVADFLGMDVTLRVGKDSHSGSLQISFKSLDQLDYLLQRLTHRK